VRVEPDQQPTSRPERPVWSAPRADGGFAGTLAEAREQDAGTSHRPAPERGAGESHAPGTGTQRPPSRAEAAEPPPAERWGEYGAGARPGGYGPPPDAALFAQTPTGPNSPAHPLNPGGVTTTTAAFTVPGYTGRGTPIPPGFYNLAYYNAYLRAGGAPLEGFPEYAPEHGSIAAVYGTFGDGRARATAFEPAPPPVDAPEEPPCDDAAAHRPAGTELAPAAREIAEAPFAVAAADGARRAPARPAPPAGTPEPTPAPAHASPAARAGDAAASAPPEGDALRRAARALLTEDPHRALARVRADLEALLEDPTRAG
jgi:hypothetical protein